MSLDTTFVEKCISALEKAHALLLDSKQESTEYDIYRSACVKEFEIILEQSGKLLKKSLKPYFSSPKKVDELVFKDIFRHAAKHGLISLEEAERWLQYRDNRNSTAHDYGVGFAVTTIQLLPQFILDARSALVSIQKQQDD